MLGQGGTEETPRTVVEWTMIIILRGTADMLESMLLRTISLTLRLAGAVSLPRLRSHFIIPNSARLSRDYGLGVGLPSCAIKASPLRAANRTRIIVVYRIRSFFRSV